jgi:hypothetical protein
MIEIRVPKEIQNFQEKFLFNLTLRQIIAVVVMAAINVPLYILLRGPIGDSLAGFVVMIVAVPIGAYGFVKYNGMVFEKLFEAILTTMVIYPQKRIYETENIYVELARELEEEADAIGKANRKAAATGGKETTATEEKPNTQNSPANYPVFPNIQ